MAVRAEDSGPGGKQRFLEELRGVFKYGYVDSNSDDNEIWDIRIDMMIKSPSKEKTGLDLCIFLGYREFIPILGELLRYNFPATVAVRIDLQKNSHVSLYTL